MCTEWVHIGITCHGTFAEYVAMPAEQAHPIAESVSFAEGALLEPLALAVRSLEQSRPMVGETVAILGPGSLGMMHLMAYRAAGAAKVFVVGLEQDRERFRIAPSWVRTGAIDIGAGDPVAALQAATGGLGADIVVETASSPKATQLAFELAAPRGRVVLFGLYPEASFSPVKMLRKGLTVYGDVGAASRQFLTAMKLGGDGEGRHRPPGHPALRPGRCREAFEAARGGENVKIVFEM